jgi:hypothetical protein
MSYGFLAYQLPSRIRPAIGLDEAPRVLRLLDWIEKDFYEVDNHVCIALQLHNERFLVRIPEVSVLCTRSGCEKTNIDPQTDLLKLTLNNGKIVVGLPKGIGPEKDCQPSFDTTVILAHAIGNAIVASILANAKPSSKFFHSLTCDGLALAHWHGSLPHAKLPAGYYLHGRENPPVSCSTVQAAIFSLSGKLIALQQNIDAEVDYLGDVHEEPSHGTNITGRSVVELAYFVAGGWR